MYRLALATSLLLAGVQAQASEWTNIHHLIEPANLPKSLESKIMTTSGTEIVAADLYLNLTEILSRPEVILNQQATIVVVADTLEIPSDFVLSLENQAVFIFARQIIGTGSGVISLDGSPDNSGMVTVISENIQASIDIISSLADGSVELDTLDSNIAGWGKMIALAGGERDVTSITGDISGYVQMNPWAHQDIFNKTFDMAALIYDQNPQLSIQMLTWMEKSLRASSVILDNNPQLANLYLQTAGFKQFVEFTSHNNNYVPYLDHRLYSDKYAAYLDTMQDYQQQYDRFMDRSADDITRKKSARLALSKLNDATKAESSIIDHANVTISKLEAALKNVQGRYHNQEEAVFDARSTYLVGIENWKRKEELNAAFEIFSAIANLGSAVTGVFVGNLEGASALTKQLAEEVPDAADKMKNLATNIKSVTSVIDNITKSVAGIAKLTDEVKKNIVHGKLVGVVNEFNFDVPSIEESNDAWDTLLIDVRNNLRFADSLGIRGARNYLAELEKLIVYGKSINSAQLRLVTEQSRLIDLMITAEVNQRQQQRVTALIAEMEDNEAAMAELEQHFMRAVNNFKRPMYAALVNYREAFKYWALEESKVKPALNKSYLDYKADWATFEDEYSLAMASFQPEPHEFTIRSINITEPAQLKNFASTGELSFSLPLDEPAFCRYDRVRLNTVRAVLQGSELTAGQEFYLNITNSGTYQDKLKDKQYTFSAAPLSRAFDYQLDDSRLDRSLEEQISIITDGKVAKKYAFAYFEPTPFTTWSIALQNMKGYDLSKVERIHLEFTGTAIPSTRSCGN
ncbi:hypothetical protein [uncultured Photobacterium sp.]|uniref:hypothetical protein n=1 Tax=uncultured Photobacterium sp. TaxID=173973 RepID=UPI002606902B|nr:hypothetical protein [uncultured Photobacterium sp.]